MKYKYPITDAVTFALVMQEEEFCKDLISRIFPDRKIKKVIIKDPINLESEKTIIASIEAKSVRLDVMFEDDETIYDIEMQVTDKHNIPKRSRYIHSIVDVDNLKRGEDYNELKKCYVIFLCSFDLFEQGKPLYSFEMFDKNHCLQLGDECYTIVVNATSKEQAAGRDLRNFMKYMMTGEVASGDESLKELDSAVDSYNTGKGVIAIMTIYEHMEKEYSRGLEEGIEQGIANTKAEMIKTMNSNGMSVKDIAQFTGIQPEEIKLILEPIAELTNK